MCVCVCVCVTQMVDMPVFFYLDPEMAADWNCRNIHNITLSYVFHKVSHMMHSADLATRPVWHSARLRGLWWVSCLLGADGSELLCWMCLICVLLLQVDDEDLEPYDDDDDGPSQVKLHGPGLAPLPAGTGAMLIAQQNQQQQQQAHQ